MTGYRGAYLKKEANIKNIEARLDWLLSGIANPKMLTIVEQKALSSQRQFAKFAIQKSVIQSISLNTLKSIANEILDGKADGSSGFDYMDSLRSKLRLLVTQSPSGRRSNEAKHARSEETIAQLKTQLYQVELLNLQRSKAYFDLFQRAVSIGNDPSLPESLRFRLTSVVEDHRDLYLGLIGPQEIVGNSKLRIVAGKKRDEN